MTPVAGNNASFPATVDVPDDSDPPAAATFNVALEGLCDRTAFLFARAVPGPALSWFSLATQSLHLIAAAWDAKAAQWWSVGPTTNDQAATSVNDGRTWASTAPGASGIPLQTIATDNAGHVVTSGPSAVGLILYEYDGSTWHTRNPLVPGLINLMEVAWEPTQAVWCLYGWDNGSAPKSFRLFTSTDRATWTAQTANLPAGLQNSGGTSSQPRIGVGGGRVVVAAFYSGHVHVSSAAATNFASWSTDANFVPTMSTPSVISDPVYVASSNRWLIAVKGTNGAVPCTEIWKSDNGGVTWTQLKVLGGTSVSIKVVQMAVLDPLVAAITSDGYILHSTDAGATWYIGPNIGTSGATSRALFAGDGNLLELDTGGGSDGSQSSIRTGTPNRIAVGT